MDPRAWIVAAVCLVITLMILTTVTWQVPEEQTVYAYTPFTYQDNFIRQNQVRNFPWIHDETQAEYMVTNTDSNEGTFTLNFTFDNGSQVQGKTEKVAILAGEDKPVMVTTSLSGVSTVTLKVIPPDYAIPQQQTVYKTEHVWDYMWDLVFN